jgi:hypothetical protein
MEVGPPLTQVAPPLMEVGSGFFGGSTTPCYSVRYGEITGSDGRAAGVSGFEDLEVGEVRAEVAGIAGDETAAVGGEGTDENIGDGAFGKAAGAAGSDVPAPCLMGDLGVRKRPSAVMDEAGLIKEAFLFRQIVFKCGRR